LPVRGPSQLHIDVAERLQPRAKPRRGPTHPAGDGTDPTVPTSQQRDDPIRLAQLLRTQHHRVIAVELAAISGHFAILPAPPEDDPWDPDRELRVVSGSDGGNAGYPAGPRPPYRPGMRSLRPTALGLVALVSLSGCAFLPTQRLEFASTEDVAITEIKIVPGSGDITVRTGDVSTVRINALARYRGQEPDEVHRIEDKTLVLYSGCGRRCSASF